MAKVGAADGTSQMTSKQNQSLRIVERYTYAAHITGRYAYQGERSVGHIGEAHDAARID